MNRKMTREALAGTIDHTLLKPTATASQVKKLCSEALEYGFASVCVNPFWVSLVAEHLAGSPVKTCTVIGFPLGATTSEAKAFETGRAVSQGAEEVDMVINVGALKSGDLPAVEADIRAVVRAAGGGALTKVIIEACWLTDEEKVAACRAAEMAGAEFVKTSTGFGAGGAVPADVTLMRGTVGDRMKVKAAGGIRSLVDALAFLDAGADRIGTSAGVSIIDDFDRNGNGS